jgi:predicted ATPase/DNA-binding SARP family transcriptional activator
MLHPKTPGNLAFARPEALNIQLLGGFRMFGATKISEPSTWRLRRPSHLVKLLALAREHRLHREQIFEYLWPDLDPAAAGNNLRVTLHFARDFLSQEGFDGAEALQIRGAQVLFFPDQQVWTDVEAFESATKAIRGSTDPMLYETALALYTGELLPEDRFEEWAIERRESLRGTVFELIMEMARLYERLGDLNQATRALRRVLDLEPADESTHVALMRLYAQGGERVRALRQYQTLRETLLRELDVEPDPETTRLYEMLLTGDVEAATSFDGESIPTAFPARRSAPRRSPEPATATNLPVPVDSFVGREQELRQLLNALGRSRLMTLIGPAGTGKTRLALEAAARCGENYPDGVWLVDLSGLRDRSLVPHAIASTLGLHESPGCPMIETLTDRLATRDLLLLLDNCEHLIDACADVAATLLKSCPELRLLATSREPLQIAGEAVWPVPPLEAPDPQQDYSLPDLQHLEAVKLFCERARSSSHGFALTGTNAAAVATICRRLEGMPLAIELAATRIRMLSVEQIAGRLDDVLDLLSAGGRDRPGRQRSLRAAIDWSYDLLSSAEQELLRRLAVFVGGFTIEAVESVSVPRNTPADRVLDLLFQLIDKSLIVAEERGSDVRYRLLETIRQYAWEQLEEAGEVETIRDRHRDWYLSLGEQAEPGLVGTATREWMRQLLPEINNIRAALRWSARQNHREKLSRLASSLWSFWLLSGRISEGRAWLEPVLDDAAIDDLPAVVRARALGAAGLLAQRQGDYHQAIKWSEWCLELARATGDQWNAAHALVNLGQCALYQGDIDRTIALAQEGLELSRETGVMSGVPTSLSTLGLAEYWRDNLDAASEHLHEAVAAARDIGFTAFTSWLLGHLADVTSAKGDVATARSYAEESIQLGGEVGDNYGPALGRRILGRLAADAGCPDEAAELLLESLASFRTLGYNQRMTECLEDLAKLAIDNGDPARAARLLAAAGRFRDREGCPLSPSHRRAIERVLEQARETLADQAFQAALAAGRAITLERAVESVLGDPVG